MAAKILVVEDNATNLQLMLYLLRAFGYETSSAGDGLKGLEAAANEKFDLILCDVLMPGIDGMEFARRYKSDPALPKAPLVAVTALAMVGDKERLLAGGFDGYIPKPIDPETFGPQIAGFLESPSDGERGPLILAVDDVQINLDLVRSILAPIGYRIVEAHTVAEAMQRARESKPALVLCDLHLAGANGFELLRELKASAEFRDIPFLFLSSTAWLTSEQVRGMQLGARKFLLRPIEPDVLRQEVESALCQKS